MQILPLLIFAPVLLCVAYFDLRYMRIPNVLSLIGLAIFAVFAYWLGWPEAGWRIAAAAVIFAIGVGAFAMNWFGGGDIKMLSVLMLFVPTGTWQLYALCFSVAMILGIMFILTLRAAPWLEGSSWVTIQKKGTFPMGISIALSGLLLPFALNLLA
jgi:prepilin peptidase CpaA